MEVVCAWCGKKLGEKPPYEDKEITHSICQDCYDKERASGRARQKRKKGIKKQPEAAPPTKPAETKAPEGKSK